MNGKIDDWYLGENNFEGSVVGYQVIGSHVTKIQPNIIVDVEQIAAGAVV